MDRKNILYYAAAAGTILVFVIALIGLATRGNSDALPGATDERAVVNAYQQGYIDGYSKGYSDGFSAGMASGTVESTTAMISERRGCTVVTPITNGVFENGNPEP